MKTQSIKTAMIAAGFLALPMLTMPLVSAAADVPTGFDSCVKAFMTSLSSRYESAPKLRAAHYLGSAGTPAYEAYDTSSSQLTLTATNPQDNRTVARAVCTFNSQGEVMDLHDEAL